MSNQIFPNLKQIAAAAGCSPRAVAAVLGSGSGTVRVGEATRQRVLQAADELGYRRNELARAMATGQSRVLGVLTSVGNAEPIMRIMEGALDEAAAQGYVTKILRLPYQATAEQVHEVVQLCTTWRLDGVIAVGLKESVIGSLDQEIQNNPRPAAYIESFPEESAPIRVGSDDAGGIRAALTHLAELGHRRIAFLGGRPDSRLSLARAQHFETILQELDLPVDKDLILHSDWGNARIIEATAQQLLNTVPRPTAIFCMSDAAAMVTMRLAWQIGFTLPGQLSVIGYSNSSLAAYAYPALTTVAQPFSEIGHIAVQRLLERIEGEKKGVIVAPTYDAPPQKLIVRASTAPPETV